MKYSFSVFEKIKTGLGSGLLSVLGWSWLLVIPTWVVVGFYFGIPITEQLIFKVQDGWCTVGENSIGNHCFGDYSLSRDLISETNLWSNSFGVPQPYTPFGMFPHAVSFWLTEFSSMPVEVMAVWLIFMGLTMLAPAFFVSRSLKTQKWVPYLLLGIGSTPYIQLLDRGNSLGFGILALTIFAWGLFKSNSLMTIISLTILISIRPQYALLFFLLLSLKRFREIIWSSLGFIFLTFLGFIIWHGDRTENFEAWVRNITGFGDYSSVNSLWPLNYSSSHSLWLLNNWLDSIFPNSNFFKFNEDWLISNQAVPGLVLLILSLFISTLNTLLRTPLVSKEFLFILFLPLPMLVPGTSWSYYSFFAIVLAAAVFFHPSQWRLGSKPTDSNLDFLVSAKVPTFFAFYIVGLLTITLVPVAKIPSSIKNTENLSPSGALFTEFIGILWLFLFISLFYIYLFRFFQRFFDSRKSIG